MSPRNPMSPRRTFTRRRFLGTAAAALAGAPLWRGAILRGAEEGGPSSKEPEKLAVGVIGVAGQGEYNLNEVEKGGGRIAALCDVDESRAAPARKRFPDAPFFTDYRRLLDQKGLQGVVISTPDHHHALAAVAALRAGLHVYCEKPLTHTVEEARRVAEEAARARKVTQMGTQIHAGANYRRVVELVQSGAVGEVREVHVWCGTSYGGFERPAETPPVPEGLHYDLWLGPAPVRPYHPVHGHYWWRRWWDFGGGALADMACHYLDLPFWALGLRRPERISAEGPPVHQECSALWLVVRWEFAAVPSGKGPSGKGPSTGKEGARPPVTLTWYDGGKRPPHFAEITGAGASGAASGKGGGKLPPWGNGVLFVGSKGLLLADYERHKLLPEETFAGFEPPPPSIPDSIGHHREWVEAALRGGPTTCNFEYAGALTEAVLLGNAAYRLGRPIRWDAAALRAEGDPEADRFLRKEYRKPWTLEPPG